MPWFGWIAVVGILVWGSLMIISMLTGRTVPWGDEDSHDSEGLEELRRRVAELESRGSAGELEGPQVPTRREENLTAEDRWRLDMLEARIENLEKDEQT
ncbi:MAG: hypothetical protein Q4F53_05650 [Nesterenkonia sp.]|uniref:hypothetical protein n=1 Tax=Nesterenkonia marinintestina TaxID=2979865 RepID=UPI0021C042E1|nr:hypothetical protein [Nesterenkonia sp. GX14115]MDO5493080.1 hypothetical protein [Nesterenkonia sp.]